MDAFESGQADAYRKKLDMLVKSSREAGGSADADLTLCELANAFRDAVAELTDNKRWLETLNYLHQKIEKAKDGELMMSEVKEALMIMFQVEFDDASLGKLFDMLDHARRGRIKFNQLLEFFSPTQGGADELKVPCENTVTTVCMSHDCSKLGLGGQGFARVVDVPADRVIFHRAYTQGVNAVAMDTGGRNFYVGANTGKGMEGVHEFDLMRTMTTTPLTASVAPIQRTFSYPPPVMCCAVSNDDEMVSGELGRGFAC